MAVSKLDRRAMDSPDETRRPAKATIQVSNIGGHSIGRFTMEPGWSWAESVKPIVGTEHCEKSHVGYCVSGEMEVWTTQGDRVRIVGGDAYTIPPGHDARIVSDEPFVGLEWESAETYAKS